MIALHIPVWRHLCTSTHTYHTALVLLKGYADHLQMVLCRDIGKLDPSARTLIYWLQCSAIKPILIDYISLYTQKQLPSFTIFSF